MKEIEPTFHLSQLHITFTSKLKVNAIHKRLKKQDQKKNFTFTVDRTMSLFFFKLHYYECYDVLISTKLLL